jgi:hypothetical protein
MENGIDWAFLYNTSNPKGRSCSKETISRFHQAFGTIIG